MSRGKADKSETVQNTSGALKATNNDELRELERALEIHLDGILRDLKDGNPRGELKNPSKDLQRANDLLDNELFRAEDRLIIEEARLLHNEYND